ncbi:Coiled-coil domain-containing protein 39 [Coelomomyces lativittatus]|nr:Coiled-coil domain-containing protein 39 [Coelomomyces lativittatus]
MLRFNEYGALPEFANSENKQLDLQVRTKEKRLSQILVDLEDQASRADALSLHMKNVRQQLAQCQTLYEGKIREKQTEEHLKELSERECGRLSQDIKNFQKEAIELMSQSTATQNSIYRVSEKIAKLKTTLKCDTKETEDWLKVQQEKEEDNLILLKYTKEDDQKIRDLAFQIEKLMKQVHQKKAQLSHDLTEAQVSRMEVVRATDEFRKLHDERKELLKQWEQTILSAQNKDKELAKQQEQYQNLRIEVISKRKLIEEKQNLTDQETEKKKETEKNINVLDRQIGKLRMEYVESVEQLTSFQDELNTMKTHLARSTV